MGSLPKKSRYNGLKDKISIVTGAAGLLGGEFSDALLEAGARVCLLDINGQLLQKKEKQFNHEYENCCFALKTDITQEKCLVEAREKILQRFGKIDILINNAANNPKVEKKGKINFSRLENFKLEQWEKDLSVGLGGAFLCSKVFGSWMAKNKSGVIVNIASDLAVIAPDQRIYRKSHLSSNLQPVKPVSYCVSKAGLLGLTRYLATYWAERNIRVNALSPGGIYTGQPKKFVKRLTSLIPIGRMAGIGEYREAILFLCSDASKYMTGQNLIIDGGRSVW